VAQSSDARVVVTSSAAFTGIAAVQGNHGVTLLLDAGWTYDAQEGVAAGLKQLRMCVSFEACSQPAMTVLIAAIEAALEPTSPDSE
jgi:hypothetical protein